MVEEVRSYYILSHSGGSLKDYFFGIYNSALDDSTWYLYVWKLFAFIVTWRYNSLQSIIIIH